MLFFFFSFHCPNGGPSFETWTPKRIKWNIEKLNLGYTPLAVPEVKTKFEIRKVSARHGFHRQHSARVLGGSRDL